MNGGHVKKKKQKKQNKTKKTTTTTTTKRNITNDVNILTTNVSLHVCFV